MPIVYLTALLPQALGARLGDCPHAGLLHKPFDLDDLLAVVQRLLG